jgi:hypothetical protein
MHISEYAIHRNSHSIMHMSFIVYHSVEVCKGVLLCVTCIMVLLSLTCTVQLETRNYAFTLWRENLESYMNNFVTVVVPFRSRT